jgi:hypothetical protein
MLKRNIIALTIGILFAACAPGLRIVDYGFTANDLGEGHWAVRFDSTEVTSKEEAEANFMVHSARWTIDHGGLYFTVEALTVDGDTKFAVDRDSQSESSSAPLNGTSSTPSPASNTQSSVATGRIEKHHVARGTIHISRERPAGSAGTVYEATRVLDSYAGAGGKTAKSSLRVGNSVSP